MIRKNLIPVIVSLVVIAVSFQSTQAKTSVSRQLQVRPLLCGKLIFITDATTGANRIGLKSCEGEYLIFNQHPCELIDYYQFRNAVLVKGDKIQTVEVGIIKDFITGWDGYVEINSCGDCGKASSVEPPVPHPPSSPQIFETPAPVYGEIKQLTLYSGGLTATWGPVFFPCGSSSPHLISDMRAAFGVEGFFAIYDPVIVPGGGQQTTYGPIEYLITSFSDMLPINSCQDAGLEEPRPNPIFRIHINRMDLNPAPEAFKPFRIVLDTSVVGLPAGGSDYLVEITISEDFPYNLTEFALDSKSCSRCSPNSLQEGEFQIILEDIYLPTIYQGNLHLKLISKANQSVYGLASQVLVVSASEKSYRHCESALMRAGFALLGQTYSDNVMEASIKSSELIWDNYRSLGTCGDDIACRNKKL